MKRVMISDLPLDLESEILSRVPANILANLKTSCKRWYSLFKDPEFIKKNFGKAEREAILLMDHKFYSSSFNLHGIQNGLDPPMELTGKVTALKDSEDLISDIFHCDDGLLLCTVTTKGGDLRDPTLVVWNPCTGETRCTKPRYHYNRDYDRYALGYGNSYKILIIRDVSYGFQEEEKKGFFPRFEIYEFSSNSWRVILDGFPVNWSSLSLGVSLKGNAYWIALDKKTGFFMLSFDFTTERFGSVPLPFQSGNGDDTTVLSVVKEGKLAVLYHDYNTFEMKIWVTDEIYDAKEVLWSEFLVVDFGEYMTDTDWMYVRSFVLDEENKVAVCCDRDVENQHISKYYIDDYPTRVFIVGEDIYREVYKETTKGYRSYPPHLLGYVPSLVHIPENKDV